MAINNRHDFHAFSASRCPNLCATLGLHERRVGEAFFFIQRTSVFRCPPCLPALSSKTSCGSRGRARSIKTSLATVEDNPKNEVLANPKDRKSFGNAFP